MAIKLRNMIADELGETKHIEATAKRVATLADTLRCMFRRNPREANNRETLTAITEYRKAIKALHRAIKESE